MTIKAKPQATLLRSSAVRGRKFREPIEVVTGVLEGYAKRGVFRGYRPGGVDGRGAAFRIAWYWNRELDLVFDDHRRTLRCHRVLANVPASSALCRELRDFVRSRHGDHLPEHRQIDRRKAQVDLINRGGNISLVLRVRHDQYEYGTRKLIHLLQELFMTLLTDGAYFDHVVETFDLDPDVI